MKSAMEAFAVGRKLAESGFAPRGGIQIVTTSARPGVPSWVNDEWAEWAAPDPRDRSVGLLSVGLVEDIAREIYGRQFQSVSTEVTTESARVMVGFWRKWKNSDGVEGEDWDTIETEAETLTEASVEAIRVMRSRG